jgi:hypothetical protein
MSRNNILLIFAIVFIVIGVVSAFAPTVDIDNDGFSESLVTEGLVFLPVPFYISGLLFLLKRFFATYLARPQLVLTRLLLPPIFK